MKDMNSMKKFIKEKGKNRPIQAVRRSNANNEKPTMEVPMNIPLIASLSLIGLGVLAFLANRLQKVMVRQPILIEKRQIVYRRKPRNTF